MTPRRPDRSWLVLVGIALGLGVGVPGHEIAAQTAERPVTAARIRAALARYAHEPSIDAVVHAAIAAPALDPERARDAAERARLAGLLPRTSAEVRRGQALDLSALQGPTGDRNVWSSDDSLSFAGSLTFQLDRLLFAGEEASLLRERRHLEERRLQVVTQVVHLYFERRRLQVERDLAHATDVAIELRIVEVEALLDVFTSGAFSRMMIQSVAREAPSDEEATPDE